MADSEESGKPNDFSQSWENCNYLVYSYIDLYKGELKSDSLAAKILSFTYRYVPWPIPIVINNRYYPARTLSFLWETNAQLRFLYNRLLEG